jgi:hypothetical protein
MVATMHWQFIKTMSNGAILVDVGKRSHIARVRCIGSACRILLFIPRGVKINKCVDVKTRCAKPLITSRAPTATHPAAPRCEKPQLLILETWNFGLLSWSPTRNNECLVWGTLLDKRALGYSRVSRPPGMSTIAIEMKE